MNIKKIVLYNLIISFLLSCTNEQTREDNIENDFMYDFQYYEIMYSCDSVLNSLKNKGLGEIVKVDYQPINFQECLNQMDTLINDSLKKWFVELPVWAITGEVNHTIGGKLRNNWALWNDSELAKNMNEMGIIYPTDMTAILLEAYQQKLLDKEVKLDDLITEYQDYWKGYGYPIDSFLIKYKKQKAKEIPIKITNVYSKYKLVGELGYEFGTIFPVKGIVVEGFSKGYDGGPNLLVQVINGMPTQRYLQIPISPYYEEFGDKPIPKSENGKTYYFEVYETGEFVGQPEKAFDNSMILSQMSGFGFHNYLKVISGYKIDSIEWSPKDFIGEYALLSGIAKNENNKPVLVNSNWKLWLLGNPKWGDFEIGKEAEVYGKIKKLGKTYVAENCQTRLVKLEDQIGRSVRLRGKAWSANWNWWFNYRGIDIYVEKMDKLPNWDEIGNHGKAVEITGILELDTAISSELKSIEEEMNREFKYIVRNASWKPLEELLSPEVEINIY